MQLAPGQLCCTSDVASHMQIKEGKKWIKELMWIKEGKERHVHLHFLTERVKKKKGEVYVGRPEKDGTTHLDQSLQSMQAVKPGRAVSMGGWETEDYILEIRAL